MAERRSDSQAKPSGGAESETTGGAWLETFTGEKVQIHGTCSLGRSGKNTVVLDSPSISRRHAIINAQNAGEFWLIDLGSSNGTFLNKRRIHQPMRLGERDHIVVGDTAFIFRQPVEPANDARTTLLQQTLRKIENVPCWLLVADIENFTPLSLSLTNDQLAVVIGGWVAKCKEIIEAHEGMIDKYLGDGFLAYWREDKDVAKNVASSLQSLKQAQAGSELHFRLALHFGLVAVGGLPSMGEESLMGKDVNFVFRMEKLAGTLGIDVLMSAAAKSKLGDLVQCEPAGAHELKGFAGKHDFFRC